MIINKHNIITKFNELSNKINIKKNKPKNNFYKFFNSKIEKINKFKEIENYKIEKLFKNNKTQKKSVSDVMLDLEKSSLYLEIALRVKNKIMSAYQEIMNMQI
ncbi:flagellar hook-basal body complex protein FliE [Buchnera aphidicola (Ceratovacuna keduensis)]|uniref:flagellar hook-basal body complex protein FliE n=1 Tax=Buchnera aphidicola TaxID=9 RepID=UPI0031B8664E